GGHKRVSNEPENSTAATRRPPATPATPLQGSTAFRFNTGVDSEAAAALEADVSADRSMLGGLTRLPELLCAVVPPMLVNDMGEDVEGWRAAASRRTPRPNPFPDALPAAATAAASALDRPGVVPKLEDRRRRSDDDGRPFALLLMLLLELPTPVAALLGLTPGLPASTNSPPKPVATPPVSW
ncbi:hypothetical protein Vafri_4799, partial [Volvox africanus]